MKSNVSDQLGMAEAIYKDASAESLAELDLRDLNTIRSRVKDEGLSFLTITLPSYASDLEKSLADGYIDPTSFRSFRKNGSIPAFLQGMIGQIFDIENGRIYDETHPNSSLIPLVVNSIRQICLAFKKVELSCTPKRVQKAMDAFTATEQSFDLFSLPGEELQSFNWFSSILWNPVIGSIAPSDCVPRHGPGATAEGISGNQKYRWQYWYDRLEPYFPLIDNAYHYGVVDSEEFDLVSVLPEDQELPVKVVPVPKTLKGPRVIAIEPVCMQYAQQGIRDQLYKAIESHWLTKGQVNFSDQTINQSLAMTSSKTGLLSTIDLSDASDRVPLSLALSMIDCNPDLRDAIEACRSRYAKLPSGQIIGPLRKFASMGSALCFPIEAMYFYTICVKARLDKRNLPYTHKNIFIYSRDVHVYGDDIIVPTNDASYVLDYLQKYNCKVNTSKTFLTGKFRESCGVDAYDGTLVTPVYIRQLCPKNKRQASELVSWTATGNLLFEKGYLNAASYAFSKVEKVLGPLPQVPKEFSGLGIHSYLGSDFHRKRWNSDFQAIEVLVWVPSPIFRTDRLEGYAAFQKSITKLEGFQSTSEALSPSIEVSVMQGIQKILVSDERHLERSALHGAVRLQRRWVLA